MEVRWVRVVSGSDVCQYDKGKLHISLGTALVMIFSLFDIADVLAGRQQ